MHRLLWPSLLTCVLLTGLAFAAPKPEVPQGWSASQQNEVWTLMPPGLKPGQVFFVQVFPATSLQGKGLEAWARTTIQQSSAAMGKVVEPVKFQQQDGFLVGSAGVMVQNQLVVLVFGAVPIGKSQGQIILMASSPEASLAQAYGGVMPDLLASSVKQNSTQGTSQNASEGKAQPQATQKKQQQAGKNPFKHVTAPGKGVQMNQIEALVVHYKKEYNPATLLTLPTPYLALLLKDGTAYTGLRVPPEDLDLKASRKHEPDKWTRWKGQGKNLMLLEKNTWKAFPAETVFPAKKGEKLQGEFKHMKSSYNFVVGGTISSEFYAFDKKGNYEVSNLSMYSTGNLQSNNGESLASTSQKDKDGSSGSTGYAGGSNNGDGPAVVTSVQKSDKNPNPEKAGSYTLNGYTLQLKQGDGKVVRKLFFFFDSKRQDFWIEDSTFYPADRYE